MLTYIADLVSRWCTQEARQEALREAREEAEKRFAAIEAEELDGEGKFEVAKREVQAGFWGYARWDITSTSEPRLRFGLVNNRPLVRSQAATLAASMMEEGVRRCDERTAIPIVVPKADLVKDKQDVVFKDKLTDYQSLDTVVRKGLASVNALGGQHRVAAMTMNVAKAGRYMESRGGKAEMIKSSQQVMKYRKQLEHLKMGTRAYEETLANLREAESQLLNAELEVGRMASLDKHKGQWLIAIYMHGAW